MSYLIERANPVYFGFKWKLTINEEQCHFFQNILEVLEYIEHLEDKNL